MNLLNLAPEIRRSILFHTGTLGATRRMGQSGPGESCAEDRWTSQRQFYAKSASGTRAAVEGE
jgi:hypothetical protein